MMIGTSPTHKVYNRPEELPLAAQVLGVLAFAGDLSMGQPIDHSPRTALISARLAAVIGLDGQSVSSVMRLALLRWAGCTANAREFSDLFGDDIGGRAALIADRNPFAARGRPLPEVPLDTLISPFALAHCEAAGVLADQINLGSQVGAACGDLFEWWNGEGFPLGRRGEEIDVLAQVVALAGDIEVLTRTYGQSKGLTLIESRAGRRYDPALARIALRGAISWLSEISMLDPWTVAVAGCAIDDVGRQLTVTRMAEILGDFADLKLPETSGASRRIAQLATTAARRMELDEQQIESVGQAALIHGIGQVSVPNTTLEKVTPFGEAEWEQIRLVPYWTSRALLRAPCLGDPAPIASQAFERLDGSGYHRGQMGAQIPLTARILQCAVVVEQATTGRPWRNASHLSSIGAAIEADVKAEKLDAGAARAVLAAAGAFPRNSIEINLDQQAILTNRERDVLGLLARGNSNKAIARSLAISPSTAGTHVEKIYRKLGVSTRAAATLKASALGVLV